MELNEFDYGILEKIANRIDKTLEITDLYLSIGDSAQIKRIIRKLKREEELSENAKAYINRELNK